MAPVHLYLAAWVLGGVLLGLSMLLGLRQHEAPLEVSDTEPPLVTPPDASLARARERGASAWSSFVRIVPIGLIGFGLTGLLAKGLELDLWPWTPLTACAIGLMLIALSYRLARARA